MTVNITMSDSGRIATLHNEATGELIAEILVHGFFARALDMSSDKGGYVFRGELFQLASYEYLDTKIENISERGGK